MPCRGLFLMKPPLRYCQKVNEIAPGQSIAVKNRRSKRNIVTMKFNLFNWILETISTLIVILIKNTYSTVIYLLITSCGTPLVYYLGIEENRRQAKARFREQIKMFKKSRKNEPTTVEPIKENK